MKTVRKTTYLYQIFVTFCIFYSLVFMGNPRLSTAAFGIPEFYYYYSEKVYLNVSTEMITICFEETISKEKRKALITAEPLLKDISDKPLPFGLVLVATKEGSNKVSITEAIERLNKLPEVKYSTPVFQFHDMKLILMDQFVVRFKPDITKEDIRLLNEENGVTVLRKSPYRHNRYVLQVVNPKDKNSIEIANIYNQDARVEYGTPDFAVIGGYCSIYPDDTYFGNQWHLHNIGQDPPGGETDADMDAPEGWETSTGSSDIVIAIIDSGVDCDHEDLAANIWINEDEQPGDGNGDGRPGVEFVDDDGDGLVDEDSEGRSHWEPGWSNDLVHDDDENGYNDDFYGWDFEYDDNDPKTGNTHGTACAGLAAAHTNNAQGVAGVSWSGKIMALAIGESNPITSAAAEAIDYAAANGADVLSNSWCVPSNQDVTDAIVDAKNNGRDGIGCVILCASGNDYGAVRYPATLPETIAVGATDENDDRWSYSNYGPELNVVAPSGLPNYQGNIWTTDITGSAGYNNRDPLILDYTDKMGGTSAAAPQVAGLAGLILSVNSNFTSDQVQLIIECTADDKGDTGRDEYYGWGRINVYNALYAALSYPGGFCVKDSSGDVVARFDILGNLFLEGTLDEESGHTATGNDEFRFQDSYGEDVAIIDSTDGEMYIDGELYENQVQLSPPAKSFIIKNKDVDVVSYIDVSGNLYLQGRLFENSNP